MNYMKALFLYMNPLRHLTVAPENCPDPKLDQGAFRFPDDFC